MATTASVPRAKSAYEIDVEDVEYLRDERGRKRRRPL